MNIDWLALTPQSGGAGINQPVGFQLIKTNDSFEDKTIRVRAVCGDTSAIKTITLMGKTYPVGTVFNFDYTGSVQQVTLPPGRYKLQCWGAQGGSVSGSYTAVGSKGGYSEGTIKLTKTTTLYIFVGGKGTDSSTSSTSGTVDGGWNGGGGSVRYSSYNSGDTNGISYPRPGGGATDIALVTSDMSYSSYRNNRSAASLLSRCIVAGGGAGASARYSAVTTTEMNYVLKKSSTSSTARTWTDSSIGKTLYYRYYSMSISSYAGQSVRLECSGGSYTTHVKYQVLDSGRNILKSDDYSGSYGSWDITLPSNADSVEFQAQNRNYTSNYPSYLYSYFYSYESSTSTNTSSGSSNGSQQGGGTSGRGTSPGTQNGGGGEFGKGANQTTTNYRYDSGAGGGGWYGGGASYSDSSTSQVNSSGGGSGFINTPANAGYRPSGYTGLELESGSTKDGSTSFPSTTGGSEAGHSGNGYARITVL